ncbi:GNAT family N-acetyltransferase [Pseudoroseomonas globiformis]|uniref:GNAT family N-acetyltransferase n=1 Tax=Teichococcus globiformis TaxID=2307229 RepID=A0ABV7G0V3_9PROT
MAEPAGAVTIRSVSTPAEAECFIRLPATLDDGWSIPLFADTRRIFDPRFNAALSEWEVPRFLAFRDGEPAGRIAASLPRGGGNVGGFGFLALQQDPAVLRALLDAARGWLAGRGAARMRGPVSFTINHEIGVLVEGGGLPMPRMPRNPSWLPGMLDAYGLRREMDVLACTLELARETHRTRFSRLLERWPGRDGLRIRRLQTRHLAREVALVREVFNDAWAANWGAVPVSEAEAATMARLLRPMLLTGAVFFAEWEGETIGLVSLIPNIEPQAAALQGRLLPFGWAGMLRALCGGARSARLPMLGIRQRWRGTPVGAHAMGALLSAAIGWAERRGWERLEISWILEHNAPMLQAMARLPAPISGRWRLWADALPPDPVKHSD